MDILTSRNNRDIRSGPFPFLTSILVNAFDRLPFNRQGYHNILRTFKKVSEWYTDFTGSRSGVAVVAELDWNREGTARFDLI